MITVGKVNHSFNRMNSQNIYIKCLKSVLFWHLSCSRKWNMEGDWLSLTILNFIKVDKTLFNIPNKLFKVLNFGFDNLDYQDHIKK